MSRCVRNTGERPYILHSTSYILIARFLHYLHDDRLFSLSGNSPGKRVLRADLDTFTAADTFGTVGILHGVDAHLALAGACTAVDAGVFIKAHPQNADLLEKCIESAQRTHILAERPVNEDRACNTKQKNQELPAEKPSGSCPHPGIQQHQRDAAFQRTDRADELTEPGHPYFDLVPVEERKAKDKDKQHDIFQIAQDLVCLFRNLELRCRDLIKQLLDQAEETEPAADKPADKHPDGCQIADDIKGEFSFPSVK